MNNEVNYLLVLLKESVVERKSYELELDLQKKEFKTPEGRVKAKAIKRKIKNLKKESSALVSDLKSLDVLDDLIKEAVLNSSTVR